MRPRASFLEKKKKKKDKPLARFTKKKRQRTQINKLRNEREITTNSREVKKKLHENSMKSYMPTNWTTQKKWTNVQKYKTCQDGIKKKQMI